MIKSTNMHNLLSAVVATLAPVAVAVADHLASNFIPSKDTPVTMLAVYTIALPFVRDQLKRWVATTVASASPVKVLGEK